MQTDGTGYFDIGGLPAGVHQIELSDPNGIYAGEVYENALNFGQGIDLEVVAGGTTSADPVLDRGGRVYGQVVDAGGNGIANVAVMFNGWRDNLDTPEDPTDGWWEWYTECYTDENGDFSMSGLQARPTVIQFQDWSGGFVEEWYDDARTDSEATPVDVRAGATHNIGRVELAPASHIAGTVTAAGGGGPLENIEVTIARWRDDWGDWDHFAGGQTDGDGHYDIGGLAAGSYRVRFWDGSGAYAGEWFENAPDAWSGQDVAGDGRAARRPSMPPSRQACVIEGHVTDGSANPLSGIEAILYYREAGGEWAQYQLDNEERMFTDGDGYYRFAGLPARTYQLRLENNDNPSPWAAEVFDGALVVGTGTDLDPGARRDAHRRSAARPRRQSRRAAARRRAALHAALLRLPHGDRRVGMGARRGTRGRLVAVVRGVRDRRGHQRLHARRPASRRASTASTSTAGSGRTCPSGTTTLPTSSTRRRSRSPRVRSRISATST